MIQKIDIGRGSPFFKVSIITPTEYTGPLMELCQTRRGEMKRMEYLSPERVELVYELPLAEVVVDFFDQMKSRTKGYASLDYELAGYRRANLVKVDLLAERSSRPTRSPPSSTATTAYVLRRRMCEKLKELIPRQMFDVPIQAAIGGKIISRETVQGEAQRRARPSATAATSPASASSSRSRKRARRR